MKYIKLLVILLSNVTLIQNVAIFPKDLNSSVLACSEDICTTKACISTGIQLFFKGNECFLSLLKSIYTLAHALLTNIDQTVDPC